MILILITYKKINNYYKCRESKTVEKEDVEEEEDNNNSNNNNNNNNNLKIK